MRARGLLALTVLATALLLSSPAGPASAHVAVTSQGAIQGAEAVLTFRVRNEKDVATVRLEIALPTDTPIASVSVQPRAGWIYQITTAAPIAKLTNEDGDAVTEMVSRVTWTASAGGIKPGEFEEFQILADPLPKAQELVFKALQTYSDATVVSWIQTPVAGGPDPAFPAPILTLAAADPLTSTEAVGPADTASAALNNIGTTLGAVGVGAGALALLGAGYAITRSRRLRGTRSLP